MDWTQTLTIILSIVGSMVAVWYAFYKISREDLALTRQKNERDLALIEKRNERDLALVEKKIEQDEKRAREDMKRHDIELAESRREFARAHALWADLLKKINDVKCDQPKRSRRKRRKFAS